MNKQAFRQLRSLFFSFLRVGAFTVGGGYAMIPLLQRELVGRHNWLSDEEFLDCVALSQAMPGVFAVNIAAIVGKRLCGTPHPPACRLFPHIPRERHHPTHLPRPAPCCCSPRRRTRLYPRQKCKGHMAQPLDTARLHPSDMASRRQSRHRSPRRCGWRLHL